VLFHGAFSYDTFEFKDVIVNAEMNTLINKCCRSIVHCWFMLTNVDN